MSWFFFFSFKAYYVIHNSNEIYLIYLNVDYSLCITRIMHQQQWGYKAEEKIYLEYANEKVE
jgi:hypothetical protein